MLITISEKNILDAIKAYKGIDWGDAFSCICPVTQALLERYPEAKISTGPSYVLIDEDKFNLRYMLPDELLTPLHWDAALYKIRQGGQFVLFINGL